MHWYFRAACKLGLSLSLSACHSKIDAGYERASEPAEMEEAPGGDTEEAQAVTVDGITVTLPPNALDPKFSGSKLDVKSVGAPALTDSNLIALSGAKVTLTDAAGGILASGSLAADLSVEMEITQAMWSELSEEQRENLVVIIQGGSDDATITLPLDVAGPGRFTITLPKEFVEGTSGEALLTLATRKPAPGTASPPILANEASQTYAVTADVSLRFTNTGAAATACSVSPALPAGLTLTLTDGTCQIAGTPTTPQSATTYTVTATAADGRQDAATVSIAVNAANPPVFSAVLGQAFPATASVTPLVLTNTGAATASCLVTPTLPAGLSIAVVGSTCEISGTPTTPLASASYTVTATGADGSKATTTFNITIVAAVPPSLANQAPKVYTTTVPISVLVFANTGGAVVSCSVDAALPAGLSLAPAGGTCQITGTPTATTTTTTYTITGTAADAATGTATVDIAVVAAMPPALANASTQSYFTTVAIAALSFANSGDIAIACAASPTLPAGLTLVINAGTCEINGTPTATQSVTTHAITATAADGSQDTATVSITVAAAAPPVFANAAAQTYVTTVPISALSFSNTGAAATGCSSAPALPTGLTLSAAGSTCQITGTPTVTQSTTTHTITATAVDGSQDTATVSVAVAAAVPPNLTSPADQTYAQNEAITPLSFVNNGAPAVTCDIDPALPTGLDIREVADTCEIFGTPTVAFSRTTHTVTAVAVDGSKDTVTISIEVTADSNVRACPTGYIPVPEYTDSDTGTVAAFCVMKYEAKNVGGVATSQAASTPWAGIQRGATSSTADSAWKACKDIAVAGYDFDLISNAQWQSLARQIERYEVAGSYANWQNHSISGSNSLNRGNSDSGETLAADGDDANGCFGTATPIDCNNAWHMHKRTHSLPNGEVIWDLAGNVFEWVRDNSNFGYYVDPASQFYWFEFSASMGIACLAPGCTGPQGLPKAAFGPYGDYTGKPSNPFSAYGLGLYYGDYGGALIRGDRYDSNEDVGVFSILFLSPSSTHAGYGFRCVAVPVP